MSRCTVERYLRMLYFHVTLPNTRKSMSSSALPVLLAVCAGRRYRMPLMRSQPASSVTLFFVLLPSYMAVPCLPACLPAYLSDSCCTTPSVPLV